MFERKFETGEEVTEWYSEGTGDTEAVTELVEFLNNFIHGLDVESVMGGCCVTSSTKDKAGPYIDSVQDRLFIAGGGCG